jgi:hypothetical protein
MGQTFHKLMPIKFYIVRLLFCLINIILYKTGIQLKVIINSIILLFLTDYNNP